MVQESEQSTTGGAVDRSFALLQAVVGAGEPLGIRELGRRTGLPRSTTSRLIAGLVDLGMVERTSDRRVLPGSALATLQVDGGPAPLLRDQLRPLLIELADLHDESVALAIDDGDAVLYLSQIDAGSPVRAPDVHAERHPFHLVAHGLVLMASWSRGRLDRYLSDGLPALTARSVVDAAQLRKRLARIRDDGFAWTLEEFDDDVNGVAVMVPGDGEPMSSVGYFGPSYRLAPDQPPGLAQSLLAVVERRAPPLLGA